MGQIFHVDIWPLITSAGVNIRVTYQQKKKKTLIPWYITWNNTIQHSHIQSRKICKLEQMSLNTRLKNVHGRGSFDVYSH